MLLCWLFLFLFCSSSILNLRVSHTIYILFPFRPISVLCHSDWLFHGESCPHLDVVHPGCAWSSSPACTWHCSMCSLHYLFFFPGNSLVLSWSNHSMLASLLWQSLIVPSLFQLCRGSTHLFSSLYTKLTVSSSVLHLKGVKTSFFNLFYKWNQLSQPRTLL